MRELLIGGRRIADNTDAYVIADIDHDPWTDPERAGALFLQAALAGAHAVVLAADAMSARTRDDEAGGGPRPAGAPSNGHREFSRTEYASVAEQAVEVGLELVPTAADRATVEFLGDLGAGVSAVRTEPADITNLPLLGAAAKLGRPMLVGVRGATGDDVRRAVDAVLPVNPELALVQCAEVRPRSAAELNLGGIVTLLAEYPGLVTGYSGNRVCPEQSWIAYAVGARILEMRMSPDRDGAPGRRRPTLDPLGLVRYDGQQRWGGSTLPIRIGGGGSQ